MQRTDNFIKSDKSFTQIRKSAWLVTVVVAIGGQFYPYLGLLVPFIMVALIGMSFFKGRYWCGNFCPHGSFFDFLLLPISRNVKIPALFKSKVTITLFFVFFMFNLSRRFVAAFGSMGEVSLLSSIGTIFSTTYLMVLIVGGFLAIVLTPRTWCQFCPMGSMQTLVYKLGKGAGAAEAKDEKITIEHPDLCLSCGKCAKVCPMQLTPHEEFDGDNNQFNDERCIKCSACVESCPVKVLHLADAEKNKELKEKGQSKLAKKVGLR